MHEATLDPQHRYMCANIQDQIEPHQSSSSFRLVSTGMCLCKYTLALCRVLGLSRMHWNLVNMKRVSIDICLNRIKHTTTSQDLLPLPRHSLYVFLLYPYFELFCWFCHSCSCITYDPGYFLNSTPLTMCAPDVCLWQADRAMLIGSLSLICGQAMIALACREGRSFALLTAFVVRIGVS